MKYRQLGKTDMTVSEVALGCEGMIGAAPQLMDALVKTALDSGMNFLDIFCAEPDVRDNVGVSLKGRRQEMYIQGHIGSCWRDGQYLRSREAQHVKPAFEDLMARLGTDYLDVGVIHYVDNDTDYDTVFNGWFIDYVLALKKTGRIHYTGLSSHNPTTALRAVKNGLIDVLLFSVNPCYDLQPPREEFDEVWKPENYQTALTWDPVREELYRTCEARGGGPGRDEGFRRRRPAGCPVVAVRRGHAARALPALCPDAAGGCLRGGRVPKR